MLTNSGEQAPELETYLLRRLQRVASLQVVSRPGPESFRHREATEAQEQRRVLRVVRQPALGDRELLLRAVAPYAPVQVDERRLPSLPESPQNDLLCRVRLAAGDQCLEVVALYGIRIAKARRVIPPHGPETDQVARCRRFLEQIAVDACFELVDFRRTCHAVLAKLRHERGHRLHIAQAVVSAKQ